MKKLIKSEFTIPYGDVRSIFAESESVTSALRDVLYDYFTPNLNLDFDDYELNKNLTEFIFSTYNLNSHLIYLQRSNKGDYNFNSLDIFKDNKSNTLYNQIYTFMYDSFNNNQKAGMTLKSRTLQDLAKLVGGSITDETLPKGFSSINDKVTVVVFNPKHIGGADSLSSTPLWVLIHEMVHTLLDTADEQKVQRKTFDILYQLGFYDDYAAEFFKAITTSRESFYNIFDYVVDYLKEKDVALLNDILNTAYYALKDLKTRVGARDNTRLDEVINEILSILGSNLGTPDGLEGILY